MRAIIENKHLQLSKLPATAAWRLIDSFVLDAHPRQVFTVITLVMKLMSDLPQLSVAGVANIHSEASFPLGVGELDGSAIELIVTAVLVSLAGKLVSESLLELGRVHV